MVDLVRIERLSRENLPAIARSEGGNGWKAAPDVWARNHRDMEAGKRLVLVAVADGEALGYGSLIWQSAYPPFRQPGIPEINGLVTAKPHRGRGVAMAIIAEFERTAAGRGRSSIGLGVGLYADYGAAQRLYALLGYVPDGRGITSNHRPVVPGSLVRADDELVLWLTKSLPAIAARP